MICFKITHVCKERKDEEEKKTFFMKYKNLFVLAQLFKINYVYSLRICLYKINGCFWQGFLQAGTIAFCNTPDFIITAV